MKATAKAYSNTALIKYWGKGNDDLIIPLNNSISITLDCLSTITTVEFSNDFKGDSFILNGEIASEGATSRVIKHLDLIRRLANANLKAKVMSNNDFPTAAGLASSASGFAALTVATCAALGLDKSEKELSIISRQGSGSSSRSIPGGFVEWFKDDGDGYSYAKTLADKEWMDVRDIVVIFDKYDRKISTRDAMRISKETSPFFNARLINTEQNLMLMRQAIKEQDFSILGSIAEKDCLSMHAVALTSNPSQLFWTCDTLSLIRLVYHLREEGFEAYFTIDTGANMHILTQSVSVDKIETIVKQEPYVKKTICAKPGDGAQVIENHLF